MCEYNFSMILYIYTWGRKGQWQCQGMVGAVVAVVGRTWRREGEGLERVDLEKGRGFGLEGLDLIQAEHVCRSMVLKSFSTGQAVCFRPDQCEDLYFHRYSFVFLFFFLFSRQIIPPFISLVKTTTWTDTWLPKFQPKEWVAAKRVCRRFALVHINGKLLSMTQLQWKHLSIKIRYPIPTDFLWSVFFRQYNHLFIEVNNHMNGSKV